MRAGLRHSGSRTPGWLAGTFAAPEHRGSRFPAAGWRRVGGTSGRRVRAGVAEPARRVPVLPLEPDWKARLGARRTLGPGDGPDGAAWAENGSSPATRTVRRARRRSPATEGQGAP